MTALAHVRTAPLLLVLLGLLSPQRLAAQVQHPPHEAQGAHQEKADDDDDDDDEGEAQASRYGTVHRGEVDDAIRVIRDARQGAGLGDGSCRQTAMVLCAMGNCHRFYFMDDGPYVRDAVRHLFTFRTRDGAFADAGDSALADRIATTTWVIDALSVMAPKDFAADIDKAKEWLTRQSLLVHAGFQALVGDVLEATAQRKSDPHAFGEADAQFVKQGYAKSDVTAKQLVEPLARMVACQVAARRLDQDQDKAAAAKGAWSESQQKGVDFLMQYMKEGMLPDLGLSALALGALQTKPAAARSEIEKKVIDEGLHALVDAQKEDGSIGDRNTNYTTCAAVLALHASGREEFEPAIKKARKYVVGIQNVESRGYARGDRDYGSIGYGGSQRGDLSNLHFAIEALRVAGAGPDDESIQKAVVFLQRTQNLKAVNDFSGRVRDDSGEWMEVTPGDDGGSAYYPGNSAAGYITLSDGKKVPRSYGSMTYALLKTYTLAGIPTSDARVAAAIHWIEQHWTLEENPGTDPADEKARFAGLFYYYMVLAQALDAAHVGKLHVPAKDKPDSTVEIDWRQELRTHLTAIQRPDGSWLNQKNGRWWENQQTLCTIYVLLALQRAQ
ncbi:MAG: prenyltransferase/squalene oxidase repeat-containing protein [Planctomycetota bacterium]